MNIKESADIIKTYVEMEREPVGVKFFFDEESFKACDMPMRDSKIPYCNAVKKASIGEGTKLVAAHQGCPNGCSALNFQDTPDPIANGKGRFSKGIYDSLEVSKGISDEMDEGFMKQRPYGIAVFPLKEFTIEPDVVLIVGIPYIVMRFIEGYAYKHGYTNNFKSCGLQAVCHDMTTYPYNTDDINITMLCPGTRLCCSWDESEMGMGIPWSKWYDTCEGIKATTNPFVRNAGKKTIAKKLEERGKSADDIIMNQNYDDKTYTGGKIDISEYK
ncbi:MAG: DUF169 domain-containing protein [Firmicutes bacterium]|nr:DUF169 domain-containing protein [Bacillota bacterium]